MQWPLVAAVLTDVIFKWVSSGRARARGMLSFVGDHCDSVERGGPAAVRPSEAPPKSASRRRRLRKANSLVLDVEMRASD
jgi:hypothetical protein